jgi:hypothetical protein
MTQTPPARSALDNLREAQHAQREAQRKVSRAQRAITDAARDLARARIKVGAVELDADARTIIVNGMEHLTSGFTATTSLSGKRQDSKTGRVTYDYTVMTVANPAIGVVEIIRDRGGSQRLADLATRIVVLGAEDAARAQAIRDEVHQRRQDDDAERQADLQTWTDEVGRLTDEIERLEILATREAREALLAQPVTEAEREAAKARLEQLVGGGQITLDEFSQRVGDVFTAQTKGDLVNLGLLHVSEPKLPRDWGAWLKRYWPVALAVSVLTFVCACGAGIVVLAPDGTGDDAEPVQVASWSEWCSTFANPDGSLRVGAPEIAPAVAAAEVLPRPTDSYVAIRVDLAISSMSYEYSNDDLAANQRRQAARYLTEASVRLCQVDPTTSPSSMLPRRITTPGPTPTLASSSNP